MLSQIRHRFARDGVFGFELLLIQHRREFVERNPSGVGREVPAEQIFQSIIFEGVEGEIHKARKRQPNRAPLLGQGGVDAPRRKWSPSFEGAAGVVCSTTDNRWLEPTTPSAPAKEASRHFVDGRSISLCFALSGSRFAPSLAKEGSFACPKIWSKKQKVTILLPIRRVTGD